MRWEEVRSRENHTTYRSDSDRPRAVNFIREEQCDSSSSSAPDAGARPRTARINATSSAAMPLTLPAR
jgi:hypothetical protein